MNDPEVFTESVVAPLPDAHPNGSNGPAGPAPAADAVSTTSLVAELTVPVLAPPEAVAEPKLELSPTAVAPTSIVPAPAPPVAVIVPPDPASDSLEERLRRLEATLTAIAEVKSAAPAPVAQVIPQAPGRGAVGALRDSASRVVSAGRWLLPLAAGSSRASAEEPPTFASESKSPWFLFDALNELITYKYMYGDPRYRLTWTGRVMPLVFLVLVLVPWASLPMISLLPSILSTILAKVLDLFFAFLLFKVLNREARRYRTLVPQYPPIVPH